MSGRPRKSRLFKGTPQKNLSIPSRSNLDNIANQTTSDNEDSLLGLRNDAENVCFLNSVIQILYHLNLLQDYLQNNRCANNVSRSIRCLFNEIKNSLVPVKTSSYLSSFSFPGYLRWQQFDSHECLLHLLDNIYPDRSNDCPFNVQTVKSMHCESPGCNNLTVKVNNEFYMPLNVDDSGYCQTITSMLEATTAMQYVADYRCERCHITGSSFEKIDILNEPDILIFLLCIFRFEGMTQKRVIPSVNIEENLDVQW